MAISFVNAGALVSSATSPITGTLPTGYASGTLFIAVITTREDSPTPTHNITTSGAAWTQIGTTAFLDMGTTGIAQSVWYRRATSASETAPSASCTTPNGIGCSIVAFNGVDDVTPLDGVTVLQGTNAAATTLQPNGGTGITTGTNGAWVISVCSSADDNAHTLSTANGFTLRIGGADYDSTDGGDYAQSVATIEKATAGNQTAPTHNQSAVGSDEWAWHLFVLRADPDISVSSADAAATGTGYAAAVARALPASDAAATGAGFAASAMRSVTFTEATATGTAYDATVDIPVLTRWLMRLRLVPYLPRHKRTGWW